MPRNNANRLLERPNILIVCEGEQTERNYLKGFALTTADIKSVGIGSNGDTLLRKTQRYIETSTTDYEQVWCIFDKDSVNNNSFNQLINKCLESGFSVAYSNPTFELWLLLHFENIRIDEPLNVDRIIERLNLYLPDRYDKTDPDIFDYYESRVDTAIERASTLNNSYQNHIAKSERNPNTTIYELVKELKRYEL